MSVCLCVPHRYCTDPNVTWGNGRVCPVIVHYWADLQSVHGYRCYDNVHACKLISFTLQMRIAPNAKCQRLLVLVLWLFFCATAATYLSANRRLYAANSNVHVTRSLECEIETLDDDDVDDIIRPADSHARHYSSSRYNPS